MAQPVMTVLQVLPALEGGGVERGTLEVARELVRRGHRSLVVSAGGRMVHELERAGSEHIAWPIGTKSLFTLRWVRRLRRLLREQRVDILHARSRMPAWVAYLAWRGMVPAERPRFVTTVHGLYSVNRYSRIMTKGEAVVVVSDTVRDYVLKNYPRVDPRRVRVIYRGVDRRAFPHDYHPPSGWLDQWYKDHPWLLERMVLTLPGRLTRLKGHADLIEIMAHLRAEGRDVHALVVGDEDPRRRRYAEEIYRKVRQAGLEDRFTFMGHRNDMREIYATSNMVLSLSRKPESFGRTVLEALSVGTPVVGYKHGGVGEILGRLFPYGAVAEGDPVRAAQRIAALLDRRVDVPADHPFELGRMLDQTLALYQDLTAERRARRAGGREESSAC